MCLFTAVHECPPKCEQVNYAKVNSLVDHEISWPTELAIVPLTSVSNSFTAFRAEIKKNVTSKSCSASNIDIFTCIKHFSSISYTRDIMMKKRLQNPVHVLCHSLLVLERT